MDADLDTLATALYVRTDDLLKESPQLAPHRPEVGIGVQLSDAELVTLAVMQALLGFTSEARCRGTPGSPAAPVPLPAPAARLQQAAARRRIADPALHPRPAADASVWTDDVWVVDSTPSNAPLPETARRSTCRMHSTYCASHSRWFCLRCTWCAPCTPARRLRPPSQADSARSCRMLTAPTSAAPRQTLIAQNYYAVLQAAMPPPSNCSPPKQPPPAPVLQAAAPDHQSQHTFNQLTYNTPHPYYLPPQPSSPTPLLTTPPPPSPHSSYTTTPFSLVTVAVGAGPATENRWPARNISSAPGC